VESFEDDPRLLQDGCGLGIAAEGDKSSSLAEQRSTQRYVQPDRAERHIGVAKGQLAADTFDCDNVREPVALLLGRRTLSSAEQPIYLESP